MACRLLAHSWMCNGRMCDVGCEMSMMWHVRTVVCCASPNPSGVAPLEPRPRASMIDRRYDSYGKRFFLISYQHERIHIKKKHDFIRYEKCGFIIISLPPPVHSEFSVENWRSDHGGRVKLRYCVCDMRCARV